MADPKPPAQPERITQVRCHKAIQVGALAMESISEKSHKVKLDAGAHGIWVTFPDRRICIPYAAIAWWGVE